MKRSGHSGGFTLMETVLAMAIIGMLAAVAVFSFSNVNKSAEFQNAGDQLLTDLELTRQQAIKEQKPYTVAFSIANSSYEAIGVPDLDGATDITTDLSAAAFGVTGMDLNLQNVVDHRDGARAHVVDGPAVAVATNVVAGGVDRHGCASRLVRMA